jgi:hypothetical protein
MLQSGNMIARIAIVAVAFILAVGSFSVAQQGAGRQGPPPFDTEKYIADLDTALELTDDQVAEVTEILKQAFQRAQRQGQGRRGRGGMGRMNQLTDVIVKVLTEEQAEGFHEFNLNRMVDASMVRYAVLELTEEQQATVRTIVSENMKATTAMREKMQQGGDRQAMMETFRANRQALNEKIGAVLTDEQKPAFEQMNQRRGGGRGR